MTEFREKFSFLEQFIIESKSRSITVLCGDINRDFCEQIASFIKNKGLEARVYEIIKAKQRERIINLVLRTTRDPLPAKLVAPLFIFASLSWILLKLLQVRVKKEVIESIEKSNAVIWIGLYEDFDVYFLVSRRIHRAMDSKHVLFLKHPTRETAEKLNITYEEYFENYLNALNISWEDLKKNAEKIKKQIELGTTLRVRTKHGTDFTLHYNPGEFRAFYGLVNEKALEKGRLVLLLPEGELSYISLKNPLRIDGRMFFDSPNILYDRVVSGVEIVAKNGYVIEYNAERGRELLDKFFKHKDMRKIYEFSFGLNPGIKPCGSIYFDEKAYRTIHVGFARPATPLHFDFVMLNPEIYVDGYKITW